MTGLDERRSRSLVMSSSFFKLYCRKRFPVVSFSVNLRWRGTGGEGDVAYHVMLCCCLPEGEQRDLEALRDPGGREQDHQSGEGRHMG